mmetsp:Transcript_2893/g.4555  ORF Transcript_2893/g.4555 Transcript_2893/m.4555 type:complete len:90 (-) Transcript_2893:627-896(-)
MPVVAKPSTAQPEQSTTLQGARQVDATIFNPFDAKVSRITGISCVVVKPPRTAIFRKINGYTRKSAKKCKAMSLCMKLASKSGICQDSM